MVKTTLKKKVPQIVDALNSRIRLHHRELIQMHYDHLIYIENRIEELESKSSLSVIPYREEMNLLMTIPGIKKDAAAGILAEIGIDMAQFPSDGNLSSWGRFSPGNNESAGKIKST